mmetsp:Transcript_6688/g.10873  ORF Transcript_6688/g.10873 Transcript_6688/m.10873 type:complete len:225 (-) Transcript_6688:363-1037(-)
MMMIMVVMIMIIPPNLLLLFSGLLLLTNIIMIMMMAMIMMNTTLTITVTIQMMSILTMLHAKRHCFVTLFTTSSGWRWFTITTSFFSSSTTAITNDFITTPSLTTNNMPILIHLFHRMSFAKIFFSLLLLLLTYITTIRITFLHSSTLFSFQHPIITILNFTNLLNNHPLHPSVLTAQSTPNRILGTIVNFTFLHLGTVLAAHAPPLDLVGAVGDLALWFWREE